MRARKGSVLYMSRGLGRRPVSCLQGPKMTVHRCKSTMIASFRNFGIQITVKRFAFTSEHSYCVSRVLHIKREYDYNYYYEDETGSAQSTVLFSSAHSRLTSWLFPCCASLVRSTHGLVSTFVPMGRPFGTSRPNASACSLQKRPESLLIGSHYHDSQ